MDLVFFSTHITKGENQMKILSILAVLSLVCLFVGCGEGDEETMDEPEGQTPDIATITGNVTLEGENDHSRTVVNLYRDEIPIGTSETDASGNYSIGLKRIGSHKLVFEKEGFVSVSQEISITEGANPAESAMLQPGGVVTGIVRYDVRTPDKTQLEATIINESNGQEIVVKSAEKGKYEITVLPGIYTVIVEDTVPDAGYSPVEHKGIEVKVGDSIILETLLTTWPYFEAEDATEINRMEIEDDPALSGGACIVAAGGRITFEIMIPEDGDYIIWGRVWAKDGDSDSFFVGVNVDEASDLWDLPEGGTWRWHKAPPKFKMSKGKNSLTVKTREVNSKLDRIFLTTSSSAQP